MENKNLLLNPEIKAKIYFIRGHRVMLDSDLAELYRVPVKRLNEQVRRNLERFPADFMFQLADIEEENLKSQIATSSLHGGKRKVSTVFTQEGIAMLSGVLHGETAVKVNIEIMRTFVRIKNSESENQALWLKINRLEKKYDSNFSGVFEAIRELRSGELPNQHGKIKPMGRDLKTQFKLLLNSP